MLAVLCFLLLVACCCDYSRGRIPNLLLLGILALGMGEIFWNGNWMDMLYFLMKNCAVMFFLYPFFKIGTVGAGDVKLIGICAGFFPGNRIIFFLFFSMLASAMISLIKLYKENNAKERFLYLGEYITDVMRTGNIRLYLKNEKERKAAGICLSGPVLFSVLLHWGGVY